MSHLYMSEECNGLSITIDLPEKVNIVRQDSGTGKTFLFKLLHSICLEHGWKYHMFDSSTVDMSMDAIIETCKTMDIVSFDNADLYINNQLIDAVRDLGIIALVSIKYGMRIKERGLGKVFVKYTEKDICVKESC